MPMDLDYRRRQLALPQDDAILLTTAFYKGADAVVAMVVLVQPQLLVLHAATLRHLTARITVGE